LVVVVLVVVVIWFFIFTFRIVVFWLVKSCSLVCGSSHFRAMHYSCLYSTDAVSHISHSYPKKPKCESSLLLKQKILYLCINIRDIYKARANMNYNLFVVKKCSVVR